MRVLLRHPETGMFYAGNGEWTSDDHAAVDFEETDLAMDEVSQSNLGQIEVLMKFDQPAFEIPLKIVGLGN